MENLVGYHRKPPARTPDSDEDDRPLYADVLVGCHSEVTMSADDSLEDDEDADGPPASTRDDCPCLTADLPGIGGTIKGAPEDFIVEEIPVYHPRGEGEHLFLWVEKRNVSAEQLMRHVGRTLGISDRDIGVAGLKDRFAVTRQFISVPAKLTERVASLETDDIRVLSAERHTNKLRTGHLKGNRFTIVVRNVSDDAIDKGSQIAERISALGFPNYFGAQRFGHEGETVRTGLDLLSGKKSKADLPRSRARFLLRLSISAVQSQLFNRALAERLRDGLIGRVLAGDVMQVVATGGLFVAADIGIEQARFDSGETTITGPIFGPKMRRPEGEPAEREQRMLAENELRIEDFARFAKLAQGTRRPYLVRPADLTISTISSEPNALCLEFVLPAGVYATTLLREFQKCGEGMKPQMNADERR